MFDNFKEFTIAKKQYYIDLVNEYAPFRFLVTFTFQYIISDKEGLKFADICWRRTTKKLFEKSPLPLSSIGGIVVLEHASIYKLPSGEDGPKNCHFHFLVKNSDVFSDNDEEAMAQLHASMWKACRNFKDIHGRQLVSTGEKGIDVRTVYSKGIVDYVFKEATHFAWRGTERLFLLDRYGLVDVDATPAHRWF